MDPTDWIETEFPRLAGSGRYTHISPIDQDYNCIAFAAGDTGRWWWPKTSFLGGAYWPPGVAREESLGAFVAAFETLGYRVCSEHEVEPGFEKVAIYVASSGMPTHAARQQADGTWLSKLGQGYDIVHDDIEGVGGDPGYGEVAVCLRRPDGTIQSPQLD